MSTQKTVTVYTFAELSDNAKQKAILEFSDINTDYDWYQNVYDDAARVGLEITGFDIDRGSYCKGKFEVDAEYCAKLIISEHGEKCETYKTASAFLERYNALSAKLEVANGKEVNDDDYEVKNEISDLEDKISELEDEFLQSILEDYRINLQNEYEYLSSEKVIIGTIEANDYEFTEDGKQFRY